MAIAALMGVGLSRLQVDTSTSSFLDRGDPAWARYQESSRIYGGDEIVVVAVAGDEPFDPEVLRSVVELSARFEELPGVRRVDSLATVPLIRATYEGDLELDAALARGVPESEEGWEHLIGWLRRDRIAQRSLFSNDDGENRRW